MNDAFGMHFLRCNQWKSVLKIESHLITKTTDGSCARTVMLLHPGIQYMLKKIEILLHGRNLSQSFELRAVSCEL